MPFSPDGKLAQPAGSEVALQAPDGSLTVRTPAGTLVSLNATAAALWELCDGETSVREIVGAATTLFSGSPQSIERDILTTLAQLEDQGLLHATAGRS